MRSMQMLRRLRIVLSKTGALAGAALSDEPATFGTHAMNEKEELSDFIDHHTMAIELATIGTKKAVHADLKVLCGEMIERFRNERDSLHDWFERWYAQDHEPEVTEDQLLVLETFISLNGDAFEAEIVKELIRHHAAGVARGTENAWKIYHGEFQQLSRNAISVWSREICIMQQWLCQWRKVGEREPKKL